MDRPDIAASVDQKELRLFARALLDDLRALERMCQAGIIEQGRRREAATAVLLTGILPSIERSDLDLDNLTPLPRYFELNRVMTDLSGGSFRTVIDGMASSRSCEGLRGRPGSVRFLAARR